MVSPDLQSPQHLLGRGPEALSRRSQPDGMRITIEKRGSDPILQCADSSTKGRLAHGPAFCGAGKTALIQNGQKIFEPNRFHTLIVYEIFGETPNLIHHCSAL